MRRFLVLAFLFSGLVTPLASVHAASAFANPAFQQQWQSGEAITPNFWGPLATARDGQQEPYQDAQGGQRLVQYFDKGRMELTNGDISNGLLASEIVKGQIQIGSSTYQPKAPPTIPLAGDADNTGPTYAALSTTAVGLLSSTTSQPGSASLATVTANGTVKPNDVNANGRAVIGGYDDATKHNVPGVFLDYREIAGVRAIGYAISEPFAVNVRVGGQQRLVEVQVFERRVLTYTPDNPPAFQVEMGNIGQHYYQWRYASGLTQQGAPAVNPAPAPVAPAPTAPASTSTQTTVAAPSSSATFTDPDGVYSLKYPDTWTVDTAYGGYVTLVSPTRCIFGVDTDLTGQYMNLDDEIKTWRDADFPGGQDAGQPQSFTIAGQQARMFTYRRTTTADSGRADFGLDSVVLHGTSAYFLSYKVLDVTADTCASEGRAIVASFRFLSAAVTTTVSTPSVAAPSSGTSNPVVSTGSKKSYSDLYNCSDFASQADAQAYLRLFPDDPSRLDGNDNGIACESNKAPYDRSPVAITSAPITSSGSSTSGSSSSGGCKVACTVSVSGYYRKDGTYVKPYTRSAPHHK